jgi:hypothetical protein
MAAAQRPSGSRGVAFGQVPNARDLGGLRCAGRRWTRPGVIFRSARLDAVTRSDVEALRSRLRVRTIIDCRNKSERKHARSSSGDGFDDLDRDFPPVESQAGAARPALGSPMRLCTPFQAPNAGLIRQGLRELSWARVALRFAYWELWRRLLARVPFGLLGGQQQWEQRQRSVRLTWLGGLLRDTGGYGQLYYMFATTAREQLCWAMRVCSTVGAQPCLVHCHSGKDRTGLVSALLLEAVGADRFRSQTGSQNPLVAASTIY